MVPRLLNGPEWSFGLREGESTQVFEGNIEAMLNDWPAFAAYFVPRIFSSLPTASTKELVNRALTVALSNHPGNMTRAWTQMAEQDFRASLAQIDLPTLVVSGSNSQLYSAAAGEWVASQMPRARTVVFSDAGHAPHLEQPEKFNHMLSEFIDSFTASKAQQVISPV
jgi:pimeloyl-[acyl-carrier protein] methyl ester esterase